MDQTIGVDCIFQVDGTVQVRRVQVNGRWQSVGQGRQWVDGYGRHILIMTPDNQPRELLLRMDTLVWGLDPKGFLKPLGSDTAV